MLPQVSIKRLHKDAILPKRGTADSVGLDLHAYLPEPQPGRLYDSLLEKQQRKLTLFHGIVAKVHTGIAVAIPRGYYGRIAPRSGLAARFGVDVLAGVVDSDYRGELIVLVTLLSKAGAPFVVNHGDRIAQLIFERADNLDLVEVDSFDATDRGVGGFGSTGL